MKAYLFHTRYWIVCGLLGIPAGLFVHAGVTHFANSDTLGYLSAAVAIKLILDEARAWFFGVREA